jgi:hypothetical protein
MPQLHDPLHPTSYLPLLELPELKSHKHENRPNPCGKNQPTIAKKHPLGPPPKARPSSLNGFQVKDALKVIGKLSRTRITHLWIGVHGFLEYDF